MHRAGAISACIEWTVICVAAHYQSCESRDLIQDFITVIAVICRISGVWRLCMLTAAAMLHCKTKLFAPLPPPQSLGNCYVRFSS